jgi:hypothetical protein
LKDARHDFCVVFIWQKQFCFVRFVRGKNRRPTGETADKTSNFLSGGEVMKAWRSKFIFLLVVYFAGFASAVYCIMPAPDAKVLKPSRRGFAYSALKSDSFAKSFSVGMHKCLRYSKDAAKQLGAYLKKKTSDRDGRSGNI